MGKLLIIGAVVLVSLLALFLLTFDGNSLTEDSIQNITTELRSQYADLSFDVSAQSDQKSETESIDEIHSIKRFESPNQKRTYTFSSGTDRQYLFTLIPETVPFTCHITYYSPTETYKKGYTDLNTKTWKEVTRTVYSPQSRAEIIISDQFGRVISTLGFGGTYSTELTSKTILRSQEQYTITITGNYISLDLSCSYP